MKQVYCNQKIEMKFFFEIFKERENSQRNQSEVFDVPH